MPSKLRRAQDRAVRDPPTCPNTPIERRAGRPRDLRHGKTYAAILLSNANEIAVYSASIAPAQPKMPDRKVRFL